jgi:hypothetical protein
MIVFTLRVGVVMYLLSKLIENLNREKDIVN